MQNNILCDCSMICTPNDGLINEYQFENNIFSLPNNPDQMFYIAIFKYRIYILIIKNIENFVEYSQ